MRPFGLGIIGAGVVATKVHAPAIRRTRGLSLVAIADPDERRRALFAGIPTYEDYRDLLLDASVDAVAVCVPAAQHYEVAWAVLSAGKALFLEKPITLTMAEADALEGLSNGHLVAVGFNQRHHPELIALREDIAAGKLGVVQSITVRWSHHGAVGQRSWMTQRERGGGSLFDLGVHQVDLWRYLLNDEVDEVSASSKSCDFDDQSAILTARMRRGALVSGTLAMDGADHYEIAVQGTAGSRMLRPYGRFAESYRNQWAAFANLLQGSPTVLATIADGREALRRVLEVLPASSIKPPPIAAAMSIVLTTNRGYAALRKSISAWREQTIASRLELVLVMPKDAAAVPDEAFAGFACGQVAYLKPPFYAGSAYACGVRAARCPIVQLGEDHAFPAADCAERMLAIHHREGVMAVGGVVENANPDTAVSVADFLLSYGVWHRQQQAQDVPFVAGHNSSYRRDALLCCGDRLDMMLQAETVLHWDWNALGHRLHVDPTVRIRHYHFSRLSSFIKVRVDAGRVFAGVRSLDWTWRRRLMFAAMTPAIPMMRFSRLLLKMNQVGMLSALPLIATGLLLDAAGQLLGTLTGCGNAPVRLAETEYNRVEHVIESERSFWNSP